MKTINVIAPDHCVMSSLAGILDFADFCNTLWRVQHPNCEEDLLQCRVYAMGGDTITNRHGMSIKALPLSEYEPGDALFLVSVMAHNKSGIKRLISQCGELNPIIAAEHQQKKWIASYCSGTFGIAQSGILDNGPATTVWWMHNIFRDLYPSVHLSLDELVVVHDNVITGGATTSYFNVCMTLLEKLTNEIFALQMSKFLLLDKQRLSQQPFVDSSFVINKHDDMVEKVQDWMLKHYAETFSLEQLCDRFAVSKRTLIRRFKNACGETPIHFLQRIRVEKAKHYLESSNLPLEQIVLKVGYEDTASFRKLFTGQTQLSPKNYRERFGLRHNEMHTHAAL